MQVLMLESNIGNGFRFSMCNVYITCYDINVNNHILKCFMIVVKRHHDCAKEKTL
ncbi:hypothetical protein X975_25991, partial [Stegodyphus mimosarum]